MEDDAPTIADLSRADRALAEHFGREIARVPDRPLSAFTPPRSRPGALAALAAAAASLAIAFSLGLGAASFPVAAEYGKLGAALKGVDIPAALEGAVLNANAAVAALYDRGGPR